MAVELVPIFLFAIVWCTNLYNFMDGSDGLAGGMTIVGFGFYAAAAKMGGDETLFLICLSISVSAIPFLVVNFYPAKIFMGDVGSIPLGFLAGVIGYLGWQQRLWPLWYPILVFLPFIADASLTLTKRILAREKFWLPHRSHYYQRFLRMGAGHRNTFLVECVLMLACGMSAIAALYLPLAGQYFLLSGWIAIYVLLARFVDHRWKKFSHEVN
jgi:UDP-GlcNAc:undecaprenyl-phosphate/decaprenyl-phosphate GlcNAc-1-phosphate transferase